MQRTFQLSKFIHNQTSLQLFIRSNTTNPTGRPCAGPQPPALKHCRNHVLSAPDKNIRFKYHTGKNTRQEYQTKTQDNNNRQKHKAKTSGKNTAQKHQAKSLHKSTRQKHLTKTPGKSTSQNTRQRITQRLDSVDVCGYNCHDTYDEFDTFLQPAGSNELAQPS